MTQKPLCEVLFGSEFGEIIDPKIPSFPSNNPVVVNAQLR